MKFHKETIFYFQIKKIEGGRLKEIGQKFLEPYWYLIAYGTKAYKWIICTLRSQISK